MLSTAEILRLQRSQPKQTQALETFIKQTRPLVKEEETFIERSHDLVALQTPEEPYPLWVKEFLEYHSWSRYLQTPVGIDINLEAQNGRRAEVFAGTERLLR